MWSAAFMVALAPLFGINEFTYEVKEFLINDLKDGKTFAFLCNFLFAYYHSSFLFKSYNERVKLSISLSLLSLSSSLLSLFSLLFSRVIWYQALLIYSVKTSLEMPSSGFSW